jgi:gamma-glutamyltranspeptidase/glutathione hydrolase
LTFAGCDVDLEDRIPLAVRDGLTRRGHQINLHGAYSATMGGGQAVQRDISTAVNYGASDPRKDGEAVPEPFPQK